MNILSRFSELLFPGNRPDPETSTAIARAVEIVDPRLVSVGGFERKLAPAVHYALGYCEGLVAAIPGPIDINVRAFGADPLVHAFFGAPDDIGRMLGASREVQQFVADPGNLESDEFFGLIGMRRKEKILTGAELYGETLVQGAVRRVLYFADHTLHELSPDVGMTRNRLRSAAFESLAKSFGGHLDALRGQRVDLRYAWAQERAQERSAGTPDAAAPHARRRQELEEKLRLAAESLEPAHVLDALIAWFVAPESRLHFEETSVAVDRMGVMADPSAEAPGVQTLSFPELVGRDRRRWIVLLAKITRDDALLAQSENERAERYLII
jgi:hypothetical protein